jgi:hypothetical protein
VSHATAQSLELLPNWASQNVNKFNQQYEVQFDKLGTFPGNFPKIRKKTSVASGSVQTANKTDIWTAVETPWGRTVHQRGDIDWNYARPANVEMSGLTNLEAAEAGYAPVRLNPTSGKLETVILHHINKEPGGQLAEVWSSTHNLRHTSDRATGKGLNKTSYDPLLSWRKTNREYDAWFKTEQSVYWKWYKGKYRPPPDSINIPKAIKPVLDK